jgi:hypothetical protein
MRRIGHCLYTKWLVVAWSKTGSMGFTQRWRFLQPFSSYFKIVLNRCEWCWKMRHNCHCFDGLEEYRA